jgi:signal transduction histidine kinase
LGGLRTEIVASVALLTLVTIVLVTTLLVQTLERSIIAQQIDGARGQINVMKVALESLVQELESRTPERVRLRGQVLLAQLMREEGKNAQWVDAHGRLLGGTARAQEASLEKDRDLMMCLNTGNGTTGISGGEGLWPFWGYRNLVLTEPIYSGKDRLQGALRMETPLWGMWERLFRSGWILGFYVAVAMGVLILFGSYLISRNVLQPLKRLIGASERIAEGDYDLLWTGYPSHEMGRLAEALRRMSQKLQAHQRTMQQHVEELERSNRALVEAHQALVRSEKLASVGRLAAGVAHEIGNPIGSILGYVEILLSHDPGQEGRDCLLRVRSEAERIQRILGSLLDMARPAKRKLEWVNVESLVEDTLAMLAGHKGMKGVELERGSHGETQAIWADRDQIQQVLVNILLNALDALEGAGTLTVTTGMVSQLPEEESVIAPPRRSGEPDDRDFTSLRRNPPQVLFSHRGPYVFVQAKDTGPGIPEEHIQHLFEPFYTTKDPGRGTGIGLSVCLGIVESYGGRIQVKSRPGEETSFTIYFPGGKREKAHSIEQ